MRLWLHLLAQYLVVCYQLSKKGITSLKLFDPGIIPSKVPSLSALQRSVTTAELQPCWLVSGECGPWAQVLRNPWEILFLYHTCSRSNKELWLAHLSEDASRWNGSWLFLAWLPYGKRPLCPRQAAPCVLHAEVHTYTVWAARETSGLRISAHCKFCMDSNSCEEKHPLCVSELAL